jgi:hypothetical protein
MAGTGAVSRRVPRERSEWREYKLSRSQKLVKVQDLSCEQMRVSGCNGHYEFVLGAGALPDYRRQAGKAKSVTNNLPLLSVLGFRSNLFT